MQIWADLTGRYYRQKAMPSGPCRRLRFKAWTSKLLLWFPLLGTEREHTGDTRVSSAS